MQSPFFSLDLPVTEGHRPSVLQETSEAIWSHPLNFRLGGDLEVNVRSHRKSVAEAELELGSPRTQCKAFPLYYPFFLNSSIN